MSTAALEYAPLPRGHRIRQVRRIIFGVGVGIMLLVGIYYWPTIKSLGAVRYLERKCLNHQDPAGTIFYSNDPQDQPKLSATSGYETTWSMWPKGQYVIRPNRWAEQLSSARSGRLGSWPHVAPTLFVHGRNAPSGPKLLVFVQAWRMANDPQNRLSLLPTVAGASGTTAPIARTAPVGLDMCLMPTDVVRVYCGQPDPNDASHFTIDYDLNGVRGTIDGNLAGSGVVTLRPRTGRTVVSGTMCCWSPSGAPMPVWAKEIEAATTQPGR
jgi:hypothetical protein